MAVVSLLRRTTQSCVPEIPSPLFQPQFSYSRLVVSPFRTDERRGVYLLRIDFRFFAASLILLQQ